MRTSEKRARQALRHHAGGLFNRAYDACFEQGDGGQVARLFWEIAEAEGWSVNQRYAPSKPARAQAALFDVQTRQAQPTLF